LAGAQTKPLTDELTPCGEVVDCSQTPYTPKVYKLKLFRK